MAATYDATTIATDIISYARARFRDVGGLSGTTVTKPLLSDEEYQGFIDRMGEQEGLAQAALALAASFAQKVKEFAQAGGIDVAWPDRPGFYTDLADDIRRRGIDMVSATLYAYAPDTPSLITDERLELLL
jgi:hypothetical protein